MKALIFATLLFVATGCVADPQPVSQPTRGLIGGQPVAPGTYKEVVRIVTGQSGCTATLVGPRVFVTAAHCGQNGSLSRFAVDGKEYQARITRSPIYPGKDHDVAVGLVSEAVPNIEYASVCSTAPAVDEHITLLGYGCENPGGGGQSGRLKYGKAKVKRFSGYDIVSEADDAALCFGDSGGPGMSPVAATGGYCQVSVNSKGDIQKTNYTANLTLKESQDFLKKFATDNSVEICGINKDCGTPQPDPKEKVFDGAKVKITCLDKGVHEQGYAHRICEMAYLHLEQGTAIDDIGDPEPVPVDKGYGVCACRSGKQAACTKNLNAWCGPGDMCWCK